MLLVLILGTYRLTINTDWAWALMLRSWKNEHRPTVYAQETRKVVYFHQSGFESESSTGDVQAWICKAVVFYKMDIQISRTEDRALQNYCIAVSKLRQWNGRPRGLYLSDWLLSDSVQQ